MGTLLVGTGNEIYSDDGIASAIIKEIRKFPLPKNITIKFIGTDPFSLLNMELADYEQIIVVDGINSGGLPGEVYFIPGENLKPSIRPYSVHDITCLEILRMAGLLAKTWFFAVETDTLDFGEELSPVLKEKVKFYAEKLYKYIV
jgi:hydrogenase maturation protease